MKKILLLIFLSGLMSRGFAQLTKFGVMAGLDESNFYIPTVDGTHSSHTGFHAGLFTEISLGKLAISPGLYYAVIGGNSTYSDAHGAGAYGSDKVTVQYLQIPVNLIYHFTGSNNFFFGGGPYLGLGISGRVENDYTIGSFSGPPSIGNTNQKYTFSKGDNPDIGLGALLGFHFKNKLLFTINYNYGFNHIIYNSNNTPENRVFFTTGGVTNNVLKLSVGYSFL